MSLKRKLWWLLALISILVPAIVWVTPFSANAERKTEPVQAAANSGIVAAAPGWVDVQGGTRHLSAQTDGIVVTVHPADGKPVDAGTELLHLDDRETRLEKKSNALDIRLVEIKRKNLQADIESTRAAIKRLAPLVKMNAEPAEQLRQAQARARNLNAALQSANVQLANNRVRGEQLDLQLESHIIRAPGRGRVLRRDAHPGESVHRGTPVIWFAPDAPRIVRAELDERLFSQVSVGMQAEVESESGDGHIIHARVSRIAQAVGPVRSLPDRQKSAKDDRVVECILTISDSDLLIGQRVIVRILKAP